MQKPTKLALFLCFFLCIEAIFAQHKVDSSPTNHVTTFEDDPEETVILSDTEKANTSTDESDEIMDFVDVAAKFPGGTEELWRLIHLNFIPPAEAFEENRRGRILLQFIVEKNGKIGNFKVVKDEIGAGFVEELVRVLELYPDWIPAILQGRAVRSTYTFITQIDWKNFPRL